jgi:hypothetical protein
MPVACMIEEAPVGGQAKDATKKLNFFLLMPLTYCLCLRHYSFMSVIDASEMKILKRESRQVPLKQKLARSFDFVFSFSNR